MNAPGVILVIVVIFLLYMITTSDQSGAGPSPSQSPGPVSAAAAGPHYARQYRELEDVNTVLYRQQEPGVPAISALQAWNTNTETQLRLGLGLGAGSDVDELRSFVRPYETAPTQPTPDSTRVVVESKQPYFLDEALIIERDGEKYYWDWRYPRQPILIQFATDPEGYMRDHPNEYPSYVIESRDHSGL